MNGIGYIKKAVFMQRQQSLRIWELGFNWFLGVYTLGAMFFPLFAYAVMFYTLPKSKHLRRFYVCLSILCSPITGLVR